MSMLKIHLMPNTARMPALLRSVGGALLATCLISAAQAADLPVAPIVKAPIAAAAQSWTGFYAGLGFGARSSLSDPTVTDLNGGLAAICDRFAASGGCVTSEPANGTAFRVSPYAGFNWQISPLWVVGIEGDVGFADKSTTLAGVQYPVTVLNENAPVDSFSVKTGWDAGVRARLGILADPALLFYVAGGPSWMHIESTSNCGTCLIGAPVLPSTITHSTNKLGWTVGGGAEAMLGANWLVRGEYRYADYGTIGNTDVRTSVLGTSFDAYDLHVRTHTATLGIAYRFGGGTGGPSAAVAAPAPVARSWSGPYVGLGAGFRSTQTDVDAFPVDFDCRRPGGCITGLPFNDTGVRVSPYAGWNWQFAPQWVAGVEADVGFGDKTTTFNGMYYPNTLASVNGVADDRFSVKARWDASLRGRIGFLATPETLLYLTGGPSWLNVETESACGTNARAGGCRPGLMTPANIGHGDTKIGWTAGGGFETRLWRNWLARAEYRYADYGTISHIDTRALNFLPGDETFSYSTHVRTHTLTLGLGYQFDWSGAVVAKN
jgi:outer membrane immunogenic protein